MAEASGSAVAIGLEEAETISKADYRLLQDRDYRLSDLSPGA